MHQDAEFDTDAVHQPETSVMAIGSMVAGILGLSFLPAIGSIIALGLGYTARREVRSSESVTGEKLATAGIVLGWVGVAVAIVGGCLALSAIVLGLTAIPGLSICGVLGLRF